jgi:hypothetical protein
MQGRGVEARDREEEGRRVVRGAAQGRAEGEGGAAREEVKLRMVSRDDWKVGAKGTDCGALDEAWVVGFVIGVIIVVIVIVIVGRVWIFGEHEAGNGDGYVESG